MNISCNIYLIENIVKIFICINVIDNVDVISHFHVHYK